MSVEAINARLRARWCVGVTAAVALLVVVATVLVAGPADAQGDVHVFTPVAGTHAKYSDFGREGLRLGDRLVTRGPLLDATQTTKVGSFTADCVVVKAITDDQDGPGGVYRCSYLLRVDEGHLIVEGWDPHGPGLYTFSVLGGTEAFAGATGDATLTDVVAGTEFVIDLAPGP